jgi:hypothetical protein
METEIEMQQTSKVHLQPQSRARQPQLPHRLMLAECPLGASRRARWLVLAQRVTVVVVVVVVVNKVVEITCTIRLLDTTPCHL